MASETGDAAMDAYLPGAASLVDQLDSKIFTILRDGRNLVGILRSFDQYLNLVLEETFERVTCDDKYCDLPLGLFLVRGDSIVLLGEISDAEEDSRIQRVSAEEIAALLSARKNKEDWDFE
eukprot:gene27594-36397_t